MENINFEKGNKTKDWVFMILLGILLFYPPFFRGLYFDRELLLTHIFTAIVFAVFYLSGNKQREPFFKSSFDYTAAGLIFAFSLSVLVAVNYRDAVGEVLKLLNYFAIYYMIAYGLKSTSKIKLILNILVGTGLLVALLGFVSAYSKNGFMDSLVYAGRISSTLQYPNTLAIYLSAIFLLILVLVTVETSNYKTVLYCCAGYVLIAAILGTQSRGDFLIFPIFLILLIVCLPKDKRFKAIVYSLLIIIVTLMLSGKTLAYVENQAHPGLWLWLMAGIIIVGAGTFIISKVFLKDFIFDLESKKKYGIKPELPVWPRYPESTVPIPRINCVMIYSMPRHIRH